MPAGNSREHALRASDAARSRSSVRVRGGRPTWPPGDRLQHNYTALIHGHAHAGIRAAVADALHTGSAFGLAGLSPRWPWRSTSRFAPESPMAVLRTLGPEAVMTAIRGARRTPVAISSSDSTAAYHGTCDAVVDPGAPGIPGSVAAASVVVAQGDEAGFDAANGAIRRADRRGHHRSDAQPCRSRARRPRLS